MLGYIGATRRLAVMEGLLSQMERTLVSAAQVGLRGGRSPIASGFSDDEVLATIARVKQSR